MRLGVILLIGSVVFSVGLGGCKSSRSPIFFTSPESPYADVPVPASFTLVNQTTSGMAPAANGRSMQYTYESKDALQPITHYFSEKLPGQGWVLQSQSLSSGTVTQRYAKNGEVLEVNLQSVSTIRTTAQLRISPAINGGATQR